jgi:hypothetical protein
MATEYNGTLVATLIKDDRIQGFIGGNERSQCGCIMSTAVAHSATHSLKIVGGGYYEIFYGCDAGSKTITVWAYPAVVGKCAIQIYDGSTLMGEAFNTGSGAWEQLSVTFTALKKIYKVRLCNFNDKLNDVDKKCYFDDLV